MAKRQDLTESMAATTVHVRMQHFVPDTESIKAYLERLALYFDVNSITAEVPVLLTVIGAANYTFFQGLVSPAKPKDKSYADLEAVLLTHFSPKTLTVAERFRFYR